MKTIDDLISYLKTIPGEILPGIDRESFELKFDVADYGITIDGDGKSLDELYREIQTTLRTSSREPVFYTSREGRTAFNDAVKEHLENEDNR